MKPIDEKNNRETINKHIRQIVKELPPGIADSGLVAWIATEFDRIPVVRGWFEKSGEIGPGTKESYMAAVITVELEEIFDRGVFAKKVSLQ